jgi:hypothetical protein
MKYVLVNYNFNPNWVKDFTDDYLIYDRSDFPIFCKDIPKNKLIKTKNIGNVDYDRLTYLIDYYDNLDDVFLLAKSNLFKYISKKEFHELKDNKVFTPLLTQHHKTYLPTCYYENRMYFEENNSWYVRQFDSKFNTYNDWAEYLGLPTPEYLAFPPGGNFILTRKAVHKYPKEFYIKMRDTLGYTQLPAEAQMIERTYYTLWK